MIRKHKHTDNRVAGKEHERQIAWHWNNAFTQGVALGGIAIGVAVLIGALLGVLLHGSPR
jgi:hypothetical protein